MDISELKFNIGLPIYTRPNEFRRFLADYRQNIDSVFFSLPLGVRHHTRNRVNKYFSRSGNVKIFWELLDIVKENGIKLELLLNSYILTAQDVEDAANLLKEHNIDVDAVCPLDNLYDYAVKFFPGKELVFSYNNGIRTAADFDAANKKHNYDYYVIGSSAIRDNQLFKYIQDSGKKVILLVNNGCSFNCAWCKENGSCMKTFRKNLKNHSVEYLYAKQSILPNELHDGVIDLSLVDLLKFSNRTSSVRYSRMGLESYISGNMLKYIRKSRINYSLYARMQGFWRYFLFLRLDKIKKYKEEILGHSVNFR